MEGEVTDAEIAREVAILGALTEVVPPEVDRVFATVPNTCILSTRVGFEVLRHFKVKVRAIPVSVAVFNKAMVERINHEGRVPESKDETALWSSQDGSWSLGIGKTGLVRPGRWDGHLVLLAHAGDHGDAGGVLIDLSLHQSSRPQRGIVLEPLTATVPQGFLSGDPLVAEVNGCIIRYGYFPEGDGWQFSPDWLDTDRRHHIVKRCVEKIEQRRGEVT